MFRIRVLTICLFSIVFAAFLAGVGAAWWKGALDDRNSVGLIAFGSLSIVSFFLCVGALDSGEGIAIENHWGGLVGV